MNPWVIVMAIGALLLVGAGSFKYGAHTKENQMLADQKRADDIRRETVDAAREGAAAAIAAIDIKRVTIQQRVETEVREKLVYRDCVNTDVGMQLINEAITGQAQPAHHGELPGTAATN